MDICRETTAKAYSNVGELEFYKLEYNKSLEASQQSSSNEYPQDVFS